MITVLSLWILAAFVGHSIRTGHAGQLLTEALQVAAAVLLVWRKGKHAKAFSWPRHVPFVGGDGQHTDIGLTVSTPTPTVQEAT